MGKLNLIYNSKTTTLTRGKEREIPIGDLAIKKGGTFTLPLTISGDYSTWTPRSEIRDNYLDDNGAIITSFTILPLTYDSVTNKTKIILELKGSITTTLPVTEYQGLVGQIASVENCLVYDIELVDPNDATNIMKLVDPSFIQVTPEVTNGN